MRPAVAALGLLLLAGCPADPDEADPVMAKAERFFDGWLKSHGETNIVVDEHGVGLADNPTRLKASLYGSEKQDDGSYVVEVEFRIRLSAGEEIVEFVAEPGESEEQAIDACLENFTLTTFHVVYKSFINPADEHQHTEQVTMNGVQRSLTMGEILLRAEVGKPAPDPDALRAQIRDGIVSVPLENGPHWIKIIYGQAGGTPVTVAATLDNQDNAALTAAINELDWPKQADFYMVKQFIVVQ